MPEVNYFIKKKKKKEASPANEGQKSELVTLCFSRVDNPLMKYHDEMKIFWSKFLCFVKSGLRWCALLGEKESYLCLESNALSELQSPQLGNGDGTGAYELPLNIPVPLPCLHQYSLLITLVLSSSLISKHGRLAHRERNFCILSHYFLFFKILFILF